MIALVGLLAVFVLIFSGVPLAFALIAVSFFGVASVIGFQPTKFMVAQIVFDSGLTYAYSVLPLFILMGNFVARSRLADDLFSTAYKFVGHRRGGLAQATIVACGGFAAVSGSSAATAATMVRVALPAMRARGYDDKLATGAIAVGGTLGILIPPSGVMLLYGLITQTDVARLFTAGIVPGIIAVILYTTTVGIITWRRPELGPPGERTKWIARLKSLKDVWGIIVLFLLVMGGIMAGAFTPTEGGGIGAAGALVFAIFRRAITWRIFAEVLVETGRTTAMIFFIFMGALLFTNLVEVSRIPVKVSELIDWLNLGPYGVMLVIIAIYVILGCAVESISMMFLTIPLFLPIALKFGFDRVWFGVLVVVVIELGLITPPIGLNVFVMKSMLPDVRIKTIFAGVAPFIVAMIGLLLLILFVPEVVLFLPNLIFNP